MKLYHIIALVILTTLAVPHYAAADTEEYKNKPESAETKTPDAAEADAKATEDKDKKISKKKESEAKSESSEADKRNTDIVKPNTNNESNSDSQMSLDCIVTPTIYPDHTSDAKIKESNNLIRKQGMVRRANGQYIRIIGKIVDEDCIPVANALVKIWQTDTAGKYEDDYKLESEWDVRDESYDKNFGYSGTAHTNNLGEFAFLSVLPIMTKDNMAPHINMKITHDDFKEISTMMFFDKHPKNNADKNLNRLKEEERELLLAKGVKIDPSNQVEGRVYRFMITLPGINKYEIY